METHYLSTEDIIEAITNWLIDTDKTNITNGTAMIENEQESNRIKFTIFESNNESMPN